MARLLLAVAVGLLIAIQIVRNAAVSALAASWPDTAARVWRDHPATAISLGLTQIAKAAREGAAVPATTFEAVSNAARGAPFSPEPFLVRGVQRQLSGRRSEALQAFLAAERRDPRSLPAHYFLADYFFRAGDAGRGLVEAAALARLAPGGIPSAAPYLAAYGKQRSAWPQLRKIFDRNPALAAATLATLANDPANADSIMALAGPKQRISGAAWFQILIAKLIEAQQYDRAHGIWLSVTRQHGTREQILHDPQFADSTSPPPFNWELTSSSVGLAERQPDGRLHVMFYGQQDGLLARQLLLLHPGRYRMSMSVTGAGDKRGSLNWSLRCNPLQAPFAAISLHVASARPWQFDVPPECGAQWLELSGVSGEVTQQLDVSISQLKLEREPTHD